LNARCILHTGPNEVRLDEFELRAPGAGELVVTSRYTCVSPGTELRCLSGADPAQSPFPFVPGYAMTGEVTTVGDGVDVPVGAQVYCSGTTDAGRWKTQWGGHVSHAVLPAAKVDVIPKTVDPLDATLTHLGAIAMRGVRNGRPQLAEKVAVIGLGVLGQLSARLHAIAGAHVIACDLSAHRVAVANAAGVKAVVPEGTIVDTYAGLMPGGADLVVDVTGAPPVLQQAMKLARELEWTDDKPAPPRVVVQGSYASPIIVDYNDAFTREMPLFFPRDCVSYDRRDVLSLLSAGTLSVRDLITDVRKPEDAQRTYDELRERDTKLLTVAFEW